MCCRCMGRVLSVCGVSAVGVWGVCCGYGKDTKTHRHKDIMAQRHIDTMTQKHNNTITQVKTELTPLIKSIAQKTAAHPELQEIKPALR